MIPVEQPAQPDNALDGGALDRGTPVASLVDSGFELEQDTAEREGWSPGRARPWGATTQFRVGLLSLLTGLTGLMTTHFYRGA